MKAATPPTPPPADVTVEQVGKGIWWLAGSSHRSVVFEFDDHLVLFEYLSTTRERWQSLPGPERSCRPSPSRTRSSLITISTMQAGSGLPCRRA